MLRLFQLVGHIQWIFKEAAQLINIIKPKFAIPVHYGSVVGSKQDATDFIKLLYPTIKGINLINQ